MTLIRGLRTITLTLGVVAVSLLVLASSASAATATLKVKPNSGLKNDQKVAVTGSGLPKSDSLYLAECLKTAKSTAGCDLSTATAVTTTVKGKLAKTSFTVVTGKVGTGKCGTTKKNADNCMIVIGTATGTLYASAPIAFKG
jgi:Neocarzinostatin family